MASARHASSRSLLLLAPAVALAMLLLFLANTSATIVNKTETSSTQDLDILVAWTVSGREYYIAQSNTNVRGGEFEGDNIAFTPIHDYETVSWGVSNALPDNAEYRICISSYSPVSLLYNTTLTTTANSMVVDMRWKQINGLLAAPSFARTVCNSSMDTYVGSFVYPRHQPPQPFQSPSLPPSPQLSLPFPPSSPPSPSPSPSQSQPPSPSILDAPPLQSWLRFSASWTVDGAPSTNDMDFLVVWFVAASNASGGQDEYINLNRPNIRGGSFEGDNTRYNQNWEAVSWSAYSVRPDSSVYRLCTRPVHIKSLMYNVTISMEVQGNVLQTAWHSINGSAVGPSTRCNSSMNTFVGNFTYITPPSPPRPPVPPLPPLPPPSTSMPPFPTPMSPRPPVPAAPVPLPWLQFTVSWIILGGLPNDSSPPPPIPLPSPSTPSFPNPRQPKPLPPNPSIPPTTSPSPLPSLPAAPPPPPPSIPPACALYDQGGLKASQLIAQLNASVTLLSDCTILDATSLRLLTMDVRVELAEIFEVPFNHTCILGLTCGSIAVDYTVFFPADTTAEAIARARSFAENLSVRMDEGFMIQWGAVLASHVDDMAVWGTLRETSGAGSHAPLIAGLAAGLTTLLVAVVAGGICYLAKRNRGGNKQRGLRSSLYASDYTDVVSSSTSNRVVPYSENI